MVRVGSVTIGDGSLALVAGPCVIEDEPTVLETARALVALCRARGVPLIFKASLDKANRTTGSRFRGLGLQEGLRILAAVKKEGYKFTTDKPFASINVVLYTKGQFKNTDGKFSPAK